MFEKNDNKLKRVQIYFELITIIIMIVSVIAGLAGLIITATNEPTKYTTRNVILSLMLPVITGLCLFIIWLFLNLLFSYMIDVKLIRNKLYGIDLDDSMYDLLGIDCRQNEEEISDSDNEEDSYDN